MIFQIELHNKDLPLLYKIQQFFTVGFIRSQSNRNSSIFTITGLNDLINFVIPHFEKYPLLTKKKC